MLIVKVWCLPPQRQERLEELYRAILATVVSMKIGVKKDRDMLCLFPTDAMEYGLGTEVLIEISGRTSHTSGFGVTHKLRTELAGTVQRFLPESTILARFEGDSEMTILQAVEAQVQAG